MPPPRHTQDDAARALIDVAPLVSRWIERLLAGHDRSLTVPQYLALREIAHGDVSGSELAQRAGVSPPAVSQLLAALSASGLIARTALPGDRRRQELRLTPAGRRALASVEAVLRTGLASLLEELPRPETDALARALPSVSAVLAGNPPPRRPGPHRPHPPGPRGTRPHRR